MLQCQWDTEQSLPPNAVRRLYRRVAARSVRGGTAVPANAGSTCAVTRPWSGGHHIFSKAHYCTNPTHCALENQKQKTDPCAAGSFLYISSLSYESIIYGY